MRLATSGGGVGLMCAGDSRVVAFNLQPPAARNPARIVIRIDGVDHPLEATFAGGTLWAAALGDTALLDAIVAGQTAQFYVEGTLRTSLPLAGAAAAIAGAMGNCYAAPVPAPVDEPCMPPAPDIPAAEYAAIMQAAGFTQVGGKWDDCDGDADGGAVERIVDLNGDGGEEALVGSYGLACHGMTGQGFTLLTRQGSGWRKVYQSSGIPTFHSRPGIDWPDIEIGTAGANCFRFLRWDGRAYVEGGTSLEGKLCTITSQFAPSVADALAQTAAGAEHGFGFMGRVPMRLGYYVNEGERCSNPTTLYKFERDSYWEIFDPQSDSFETKFGDLQEEGDAYFAVFEEAMGEPAEEGDVSGVLIKPVFPGSIILTIQDDVTLTQCNPDEVPARFRRD